MEEKKKSSRVIRKGMNDYRQHAASYRDPAGFIFEKDGKFYRQVNQLYAANHELFNKSGLYSLLVKEKKILPHVELNENFTGDSQWYKTLLPQQLDFISYPYEWCFSQWKDAALLTLDLVKESMQHGMILKDATPFNIQFTEGAPVFIDSLSFEQYDASRPWIAYRQFIECFMGPLLLARYRHADMLKLFQLYSDGIPINIVSKLLPLKSLFNANVFLHIRLPNMIGAGKNNQPVKETAFTKEKLSNIINNLRSFVNALVLPSSVTSWNNYYEETILSKEYAAAKMVIVENWLKEIPEKSVLDIGTNTGLFAEAAAAAGKYTIAVDADMDCIDKLYNSCKQKKINNLLSLCADITNPPPAIGWNNEERASFTTRARVSVVMALALVHHLAIGKNLSFSQIAETFSRYSPWLIIEFIPKDDPKVKLLLQQREDIFTTYNEAFFLKAFCEKFVVMQREAIASTERVLYLMKQQ